MGEAPALVVSGPWRRPHNDLVHQSYGGHTSLHDADQAERLLGTRDAPIHGTTHFSQFTPLLLHAFGPEWFERGTISLHFRKMVSHLTPVQAHLELPPGGTGGGGARGGGDRQDARIWLSFEDGKLAVEGTASLGAADGSMISRRLAEVKPPSHELLILTRMRVGDRSPRVPVCVRDWDMSLAELGHGTFPYPLRDKLKIITEPHVWFTEEGGAGSPWGRAVLPPETMHSLMFPQRLPHWAHPRAVGLLGGCEMRVLRGPLFVGQAYELETEVIRLGETPRTEFYWTRSTLFGGGAVVAEMDLQSMSLKNSVAGPPEQGYAAARAKL